MIANIVNYEFMQNAFLVGFFISLLIPFIGVIIFVRRQTFIADTLGHINMSAIAFAIFITSLFSSLTNFSNLLIILFSVSGAVLIEYLRNKYKENKEVSLIVVYSLSIALTMIFSLWTVLAKYSFLPDWLQAPFDLYYTGILGQMIMFAGIFVAAVLFSDSKNNLKNVYCPLTAKSINISLNSCEFVSKILEHCFSSKMDKNFGAADPFIYKNYIFYLVDLYLKNYI